MDTTKNGLVFLGEHFFFSYPTVAPQPSEIPRVFLCFSRSGAYKHVPCRISQCHSTVTIRPRMNLWIFLKVSREHRPVWSTRTVLQNATEGGETVGFAPRCSKKTCWRRMNAMPAIFKTLSISATDWLTGNIKPFWQQMTWFHQQMFWV